MPFNIHPPPPGDDQPDGPIMGTTLQPEIQDGHGTSAPGSDHATRPFLVTFTTVMSLLHLSPHTVFFLVSEPGPVFLLSLPFDMPNRATVGAVFPRPTCPPTGPVNIPPPRVCNSMKLVVPLSQ